MEESLNQEYSSWNSEEIANKIIHPVRTPVDRNKIQFIWANRLIVLFSHHSCETVILTTEVIVLESETAANQKAKLGKDLGHFAFLPPSSYQGKEMFDMICAMVADIRPAAGAVVSLEDFFGA